MTSKIENIRDSDHQYRFWIIYTNREGDRAVVGTAKTAKGAERVADKMVAHYLPKMRAAFRAMYSVLDREAC